MNNSDSTKLTTVREILKTKLETLTSSSSAQQAAKKLRNSSSGSLLIVDTSGKSIGILTERDLVRKVCAFHKQSSQTIVTDIMSSPIITVNANSSLREAADEMIQHKVRHLLVLDDGREQGIISANDFANYLKQNVDMDEVNASILESLLNIKEGERNSE
ncbi:CBS domain-containing protein [Nitrososphaera sp. AFS]|uniref:CBS domain-containing protein n=1 Tax=Nitrososphaera sp. AFS TaxID=2301191 RepID=UPI001392243D|nr:CBS domain-containing protein [Nitrososphaera sp. AFS]NAL76943.1 CBS domain-containing protein [Nitrososphaera sp. AFS]